MPKFKPLLLKAYKKVVIRKANRTEEFRFLSAYFNHTDYSSKLLM